MSYEIRPAKPEELDDVHFVVSYSFSGDRSETGRNHYRHLEEFANPTVLLDGGKIAASLRVYDLAMLVNGAPVRMGGVSSVSCLPEHRRKGHVGRLLRHALSEMRDAGQPLSALYTPHPSLYRRYGWMVAASAVKHSWRPKDVTTHDPAPAAGAARRIAVEEWPVLDRIYRSAVAGRTGYLDRGERWWKEAVFKMLYGREDKEGRDVVVWFDDGGGAVGYMTYNSERSRGIESRSEKLTIWDFFALTRNAYNGLIRYINSHDLADEIVWHAPPGDPLALAFDDSERVKRTVVDGYMLRVVDVEQAIAARPPALDSPEGAFTVHVTDDSAPWNQGAWRIESSGGSLSATKAGGTAQISTGAATFAALYGGFIRPTEAVRSGLAESSDPEAASLADRILASDHPPFGSDFF